MISDVKQETQRVEEELLDVIIKHLENNQIDTDTAKKLASDFLDILPAQNRSDLLNKLKLLGEHYNEAKIVYSLEFSNDLKEKEEQAIIQMHAAIKDGNIEHAINVAKKLKEQ